MINLLVVEDDEITLTHCVETLKVLGEEIRFVEARTAEEALVLLYQRRIHGAFIDICLPGMDGFSLTKTIREMDNYHQLPIIFITGQNKDVPQTYKQFHNLNYLKKPYDDNSLIQMATILLQEIQMQKKQFAKLGAREIGFRYKGEWVHFPFSDVLYAKREERKTILITRRKVYQRSDVSLKELIKEICEEKFIRCHKGYAVNVSNIDRIEVFSYKSWHIYFRDSEIDPCWLSISYKKKIEALLKRSEED